jgi:hypothetical protein
MKKIILLILTLLIIQDCNLLEDKDQYKSRNQAIFTYGVATRPRPRDNGIYLSGTLVGVDGRTAIANSTITIEGRGENAAILKSCLTSGARNTCGATTPAGFYREVLSVGTQPLTLYGSPATGAPTTAQRDSECGSTLTNMYSASTIDRVVCDSTQLDQGAKNVGVIDTLISAGTVVGTFTTDASGNFGPVRLPNIATGNTYTLKVSGRNKTRRLRINRAGTASTLGNFCTGANIISGATQGATITVNPAGECANGNESSKVDFILGSSTSDPLRGTQALTTAEGLSDVPSTSTDNSYGFNLINLQLEIVYSKPFDILTGTIASNLTLNSSRDYLLSGTVIVPSGVTLTIPAGTRIFGAVSPAGALLVKQGGRIDAQGTASRPIVFSSEKATGSRVGGDWQGIILQGNGVQTFGGAGSTAIGEGDVGTFGGNNNNDSSGIMRYVRIEFAGAPFSPGNERNCLSLMGVGSGTTLEYIQCHRGFDDGFEWWGGSVNMRYIIASGNRDDQFDYADGFKGRIQFGIAHLFQLPTAANDDTSRCIEGDGNSAQTCSSATECSDPSFANITCIGFTTGQNHGDAIFVRRASNLKSGNFSHFLIQNFGTLRASNCSGATGTTIQHTYINNANTNSLCTSLGNIDQAGVTITNASETSPNYAPSSANQTIGTVNVNTIITGADSATFYGALDSGGTSWLTGWTAFPSN